MADIFVSYSSTERHLAADVVTELERLGYSAWWDHEIVGGSQFRKEIHRELTAARAVIVLWTPASVESHWVQEEAEEAMYSGKLLPLRSADLEPRQLPLGFRSLQTMPIGDAASLQRALARLLGPPKSVATQIEMHPYNGILAAEGFREGSKHYQTDFSKIDTEYNQTVAILIDGRGFDSEGLRLCQHAMMGFMKGYNYDKYILNHSKAVHFLDKGLQSENRALGAMLANVPEYSSKGAPIVVAHIFERELCWVSAGDAALLQFRDGRLTRLNENHSMRTWLDQEVALGKMSAEKARLHPNRQALRSGLTGGQIPLLDWNISKPVALKKGDWILMATQGLETLSMDELARVIAKQSYATPEQMIDKILSAVDAKEMSQQDNVRITAFKIIEMASVWSRHDPQEWVNFP